jgi:hypothetical protein
MEKLATIHSQGIYRLRLHTVRATEDLIQSERWSAPADHHNTQGEFDPTAHGFDGLLLTSLPGFPQPADDMVATVPKQLPDEFPFLLDMNAGTPLGLGTSE